MNTSLNDLGTFSLLGSFSFDAWLQARNSLSSAAGTTTLVINAVGQDRVGIVSDITGLVIDVGGNVGESQAAKLGSHFSLMMLVTVPADHLDDLKDKLKTVPDINAAVFEAPADATKFTPQGVGCMYPVCWV